jgi:hypothetical protein
MHILLAREIINSNYLAESDEGVCTKHYARFAPG